MTADRTPVSIVCVYNDARVREECLDRSIERLRAEAPEVEYLPVDNRDQAFATAGAALMHGASLATNDVVVFAHQDVVLHSLVALEHAASHVASGDCRVLGAVGITTDGRYFGRMRDRVVLLGEDAHRPVDVDSLDEVLFMVGRSTLERVPLDQSRELAWHAYAVEYGLRARRDGERVAAMSIPLTHNSLTVNLDRLTEAHAFVADRYPGHLPMRTTCGVIREGGERRKPLAAHRWRYRWMKGSIVGGQLKRSASFDRFVLSDIREDVDEILAAIPGRSLSIINVDRGGTFDDGPVRPLPLRRRNADATVSARTLHEAVDALSASGERESSLVTGLDEPELAHLAAACAGRPTLVGIHLDTALWFLAGPAAGLEIPAFNRAESSPLELPLVHRR